MSLLKKLGIIEDVEPVIPELRLEELAILTTPAVDVDTPDKVGENLITDIYAENGMSDIEKSVYKVEAFLNTLPVEMPQAAKKTTVLGILGASGIDLTTIRFDAEDRLGVLVEVKRSIVNDNNQKIANAEAEIERLKSEIEAQNSIIYNAKADMEYAEKSINTEVEFIESMVDFLGGEQA